jgi:serine/threonine protein kinase/ankyrin repeat protein
MSMNWVRAHVPSAFSLTSSKRKSPQLTVSDIENNLLKLCMFRADARGNREPLSQERFKYITQQLKELDIYNQRQGDRTWMRRPRIYSILVNIHALHYMLNFVDEQIHDISLPYTLHTLPAFLSHEQTRQDFLEQQVFVLTDARNLENSESHVNFAEDANEHMQTVRRLGQGGYGFVDQVSSNLSLRMYARKRVLRSNSTAELGRKAQQSLVAEIETMKKLSYQHLTRIVGSYTDPKYIGYLMDPVADRNLYEFLVAGQAGAIHGISDLLRSFFGCLAGAVDYLHENKIRHRDLKPQNVLIKDNVVYLADFGTALDWSKFTRQTTQDRDTPGTPNYMAPEAATRGVARNTASDMWSLGVVYLEIATVLKGYQLAQWYEFCQTKASNLRRIDGAPWRNMEAVNTWMDILQSNDRSPPKDNAPLAWIKSLLHKRPEMRPGARSIVRTIKESPYFTDFCCDDCIVRFQDPGFFFETPNNWTQMVDPQAIDAQIRSMDPPKSTFSQQLSTIHSWLAQTQSELISSVEEDAWAVHVGTTDEAHDPQALSRLEVEPESYSLVGDRTDKTRKLHVSGAFYVDIDSDGSDDDSFKSIVSQPQYNRDRPYDIVADPSDTVISQLQCNVDRPYNIVEDSSSDESGSLRSDSDDETRSAARDAREILTSISEGEEDGDLCSAPQISSTNPVTFPGLESQDPQFAHSVNPGKCTEPETLFLGKSIAAAGYPRNVSTYGSARKRSNRKDSLNPCTTNEAGDPQRITPPTPALSLGLEEAPRDQTIPPGLYTHRIISWLTSQSHKDISSPDTNATGSNITNTGDQTPSRAVEELDDPYEELRHDHSLRSTSQGLPDDRRAAKPLQSPQAPTPSERSRSDEVLEDRTKPPSRAASPKFYEKNVSPHNVEEQNSPPPVRTTEDRVAEDARAMTDAEGPIFDPLDFIEQTFRDIRDTASQATSLMSATTRKRLGGLFGRWNRANERHSRHLEYFCQKGKAATVKELLRRGSEPGTRERTRPQPLVLAINGATQRHNKCVKALIEWDCDVNCSWKGKTPIHHALENLYFDGYLPLLRMLLEAGAELSQHDSTKEYPLTKLFSGPRDSPLEQYQIRALALILHPKFSKSTDINVNVYQRATLDTSLHLAVQRRTPYAVALLLYRGANINAENASGTTPLLMAASQWKSSLTVEQRSILSFLLEYENLEINAMGGSFNRTALHQAAKVGCVDAVQMLVDRGADVRLRDKLDKSALSLCKASTGYNDSELAEQFMHACEILRDREYSLAY